MGLFKLWAILDSIATRKDGSLKIVFETQETNTQDTFELFALRNQFGCLNFSSEPIVKTEYPKGVPGFKKIEKSQSKRLRASIFVYWQQLGSKEDFEDFYKQHMERIIDVVKEKLEKN